MNLQRNLVLASDVVVFPVSELSARMQENVVADATDHVLTRQNARTASVIIAAPYVRVVDAFRTPQTILGSVISYALASGDDPQEVLTELYPIIKRLETAGFLVDPESTSAANAGASLAPGSAIGAFEVERCLQAFEDVEVYLCRSTSGDRAVCKLSRSGDRRPEVTRRLQLEADLLRRLEGRVGPRLLEFTVEGPVTTLVMDYVAGTPVKELGGQRSGESIQEAWVRTRDVCSRILDAYATLHEAGVVHGDVHDLNVIVGSNNEVRLIDFDCGRALDDVDERRVQRPGVGFYYEPEVAEPLLEGELQPVPNVRGEQYAIAALLFRVISGDYYLDFSLERDEILHQIATLQPRPLTFLGEPLEGKLGTALRKALAKRPNDRFASVREFANAFEEGCDEAVIAIGEAAHKSRAEMAPGELLAARMEKALGWEAALRGRSAETWGVGPAAHGGTAGIAYYFLRRAVLVDDPNLLELADAWLERSMVDIRDTGEEAFYDGHERTPRSIGTASLYHTASSVYLASALLGGAKLDSGRARAAQLSFVEASGRSEHHDDLALGTAGILLGCALLHGEADSPIPAVRTLAESLVDRNATTLRGMMDRRGSRDAYRGIAHGPAGLLYAALAWCKATETPVSEQLGAVLEELAVGAIQSGETVRWPYSMDDTDGRAWQGWCHGTAGYVFLWVLAFELTSERRYLDLAVSSAEDCWQRRHMKNASLCCGQAGQAYALLELHRVTSDARLLDRARVMCDEASRIVLQADKTPYSLYRGGLGVALLQAELERPELAKMPLFGI